MPSRLSNRISSMSSIISLRNIVLGNYWKMSIYVQLFLLKLSHIGFNFMLTFPILVLFGACIVFLLSSNLKKLMNYKKHDSNQLLKDLKEKNLIGPVEFNKLFDFVTGIFPI